MLFKGLGLAAVFLSCLLAGVGASRRLSRRVEELETLISAVEYIAMEIRYDALPVGRLFERLEGIAEYRPLGIFGVCSQALARTGDLAGSWEKALAGAKGTLSLEEGDYEALRLFGRSLGTTDVEGQLSLCDGCVAMLRRRLQAAKANREKRGRMYTSMGVLTGIFIVILLI